MTGVQPLDGLPCCQVARRISTACLCAGEVEGRSNGVNSKLQKRRDHVDELNEASPGSKHSKEALRCMHPAIVHGNSIIAHNCDLLL